MAASLFEDYPRAASIVAKDLLYAVIVEEEKRKKWRGGLCYVTGNNNILNSLINVNLRLFGLSSIFPLLAVTCM